MRNKIVLIFISILFVSCDIPGRITIKNKSNGKAVYRYEIIQEPDSLKIQTFELKSNSETNIMFGFGHFWTNERITQYLLPINEIEIISSSDTIVLTDKNEMFDFFKKRRRGLFKSTIKIKIH